MNLKTLQKTRIWESNPMAQRRFNFASSNIYLISNKPSTHSTTVALNRLIFQLVSQETSLNTTSSIRKSSMHTTLKRNRNPRFMIQTINQVEQGRSNLKPSTTTVTGKRSWKLFQQLIQQLIGGASLQCLL